MTRKALSLLAILSTGVIANGQVIISDTYNVTGSGSGFALGSGANSGITPSATRLTGTAASGLSYYLSGGTRPDSFFTIPSNKMRVGANNTIARFTFTQDTGTTPFDFGPAIGTSLASAVTPLSYDVKISMANHENGTQRMSFGIGTVEGDATTWDFGVQLYQNSASGAQNRISERLDSASTGVADINAIMLTQGAATFGNEVDFLLRVTDAGAESGGDYNSRVQVSIDGGANFIYDTDSDAALVNGFRFDGAGRYFLFDIAGGSGVTGNVTYDKFSVNVITPVPEPSSLALMALGGMGMFWYFRRRTA